MLFFSQKMNKLAITGPYSKIRHPQYVAFAMIMFGFLLQWPTILTLCNDPLKSCSGHNEWRSQT
ncbi:methyltransferase family protein [Aeromonas caviae]|uniref:methyltransferase family protein n=1 Tax=Aeromonas caviae TaxID=648 RepID=UPI0025B6D62A|nr:methyltransferase [Aeromonas caviae]